MEGRSKGGHLGWTVLFVVASFLVLTGLLGAAWLVFEGQLGSALYQLLWVLGWSWIAIGARRRTASRPAAVPQEP